MLRGPGMARINRATCSGSCTQTAGLSASFFLSTVHRIISPNFHHKLRPEDSVAGDNAKNLDLTRQLDEELRVALQMMDSCRINSGKA